jgi:hypothetical protein
MLRYGRIGLLLVALASLATGAAAEELDWEKYADVKVIDVVTVDPDGDLRKTPVWFVLLEGAAYLRTSRSRWLENIRRDPKVVIRIKDEEFPLLAHAVEGEEIIQRVDTASREKYGWQEAMIHVFRFRTPDILRLSSRDDRNDT